jgi:hypothetical protein
MFSDEIYTLVVDNALLGHPSDEYRKLRNQNCTRENGVLTVGDIKFDLLPKIKSSKSLPSK